MKKKIQNEYKKIYEQLKDHIWFPQKTIEGYFFRYGLTFFFALLVVCFVMSFPKSDAKTVAFLLFIFAIHLSAFIGTFTSGLLLTGFATATLVLVYYSTISLSFLQILEIIVFIISGVIGSVIIHRCKRADLTKEFARREKEYQDEVKQLEVDFKQAEKEIRIREEFISIASHELKTPLTTTLLKLQTALHNIQHVTLANFSVQNLLDMLEGAEVQTKRLGKMINDLLNVSIIRTGRLELELEVCDISDITRNVIHRFTEKAEKEGIVINVDAAEVIEGKFDKVRLEQVITNLISNAMKYGKGSAIDVNVHRTGNYAKICIKDHGIGISKEKQQRIFNLFERAVHNSEYKGLGIGLYITNQIVRAHQGRILVKSRINQGSEFTVELPVAN